MGSNSRKKVMIVGLLALILFTAILLLPKGGKGSFKTEKTELQVIVTEAESLGSFEKKGKSDSVYDLNGMRVILPEITAEDKQLIEAHGYNGKNWFQGDDDISEYHYRVVANYEGEEELVEFSRFDDENNTLWSVPLDPNILPGYKVVSDGVLLYWSEGYPLDVVITPEVERNAFITKYDHNGNDLWNCELNNGFTEEDIYLVMEEENSYVVITRKPLDTFCCCHISKEGSQLDSYSAEVGNYGFWNMAVKENGYLIQFGNNSKNMYSDVIWTDLSGHLSVFREYNVLDSIFFLSDMSVSGNDMYLSGYYVPDDSSGGNGKSHNGEIDAVLDEIFSNNEWEITNEELTPRVQQNYSGFLLICDAETGEPKEYYEVPGALGRELSVGDEQITWYVEKIADTFFSPSTSSFTIGGASIVYSLNFDNSVALQTAVKTGGVRVYRA